MRVLFVAGLSVVILLSGCRKKTPGNLQGAWSSKDDAATYELRFEGDGTWSLHSESTAFGGSTLEVSGTYVVDGTQLTYTPTESSVTGATLAPKQRAMIEAQLLKQETDTVDFQSPDQFTERSERGDQRVYSRLVE